MCVRACVGACVRVCVFYTYTTEPSMILQQYIYSIGIVNYSFVGHLQTSQTEV